MDKETAIENAANQAGFVNPQVVKLLDHTNIKFVNGVLSGFEEASERLRAENPELFAGPSVKQQRERVAALSEKDYQRERYSRMATDVKPSERKELPNVRGSDISEQAYLKLRDKACE